MNEDVRNVQAALATMTEHWQPHRLTSVNDYDVKVVKLLGEFVWHTHPDTDELFMVVHGRLTMLRPRGARRLRPPSRRRSARSTPTCRAALV